MSNVTLQLYNNPKRGGFMDDATPRMIGNWRHSTRRIGGYWRASADYLGSRSEMDEMFLEGMAREVRSLAGGIVVWEGIIGVMNYVRNGMLFVRTMLDRANAVKAIFSRIGDNLLTNGSAESGAWSAYNGATVTQSTEWFTDGLYSCKIVVADTTIRGATVQDPIVIVANKAYDIRMSLNVVSGSWRVAVNRTDTDAALGFFTTAAQTGQIVARFSIPDTNTYAGNVRLRITSESAAGTVYGDAAVMQLAPERAETGWAVDASSTGEYGRKELILLEAGMSNAAANAKVATTLKDIAWPRTLPPDEYAIGRMSGPDKLSLSLFGFSYTLQWLYTTTTGTNTMSSIVSSMLSQAEFVSAGIVDTNSTQFTIENRAPVTLWKILSDLAASGDASGNLWSLGCYANRKLDYVQTPTELAYHLRGGVLYNVAGGPMEPWFVLPGWATIDDAPVGPGSISGYSNDDPRRVYLDEIEFIAPSSVQVRRKARN